MVLTEPEADQKITRLNDLSTRRFNDAKELFEGHLVDGQLIPDELLSVAGLDLAATLTAAQRRELARQEVAAILAAGIEFESVLMAGFSLEILDRARPRDVRTTYVLHEIGEETRHSRLFIDLLTQIGPVADNPFGTGPIGWLGRRGTRLVIAIPVLFYALVLGGEEIPDLYQRLVSEHPASDPHLRAVNRYHRSEESRHLGFARITLAERWSEAGPIGRFAVRRFSAGAVAAMWDTLVHPGIYRAIGLPGWATWRQVRHSPRRVELRHQATRPVLAALLDAGVLDKGRIPRSWRRLCGVDRHGVARYGVEQGGLPLNAETS